MEPALVMFRTAPLGPCPPVVPLFGPLFGGGFPLIKLTTEKVDTLILSSLQVACYTSGGPRCVTQVAIPTTTSVCEAFMRPIGIARWGTRRTQSSGCSAHAKSPPGVMRRSRANCAGSGWNLPNFRRAHRFLYLGTMFRCLAIVQT